jgi:hypothetical protein
MPPVAEGLVDVIDTALMQQISMLRSERAYRIYVKTARRMISGWF